MNSSRSLKSSRSLFSLSGSAAALGLLTALAGPVGAAPNAALPRLSGHVPSAAIMHSRLLGRVASAQTVSLALTLPLRNQAALTDLIARQSKPGDPLYGHYLTPAEFTARFGPTESGYAAVAAAARQKGLSVIGTHPNRLILDVSGPAASVEAAFGLHLQRYLNASGREFYAPDAGPALPLGLAGRVSGVAGLDNAVRLHSHLHPALSGRAGSGRDNGLTPTDIEAAYNLPTTAGPNGTGQTIALYELDGYTPSDITGYESAYGLPAVPLQNILIDGASGTPGDGADEVTLDIELAQALAPSVSRILVYETPNTNTTTQYLDGYNRIATDNLAKQISTSWGGPEDQSDAVLISGENPIFQEMAAQGQSIFAVTGDNGAYDDSAGLSVDDPGSQPYVTGVGGTTLTTNGSGGPYVGESAWNAPPDLTRTGLLGYSSFGSGGGGGFSTVWPAPSYQSVLPSAPTMRSVPDVALDSDPQTGYSIYYGGGFTVYGGTSAAAPLWAGFTALVNQQRAAAGKAPIGFMNPPIYQIGASAAYTANFHDITSGTNLYYPAQPGYDNATGWGSFIGSALLNTLAGNIAAPQTATLTGTITAADTKAALPNVTVSAVSVPGGATVGTATTNTAGVYSLPVPAGTALAVTESAYAATNGRYAGAKTPVAALSAGQTATVNAALQPAHTFPIGLQMISSPYTYSAVSDFEALFGLSSAVTTTPTRLIAWVPTEGNYVFYPTAPANTLTPGTGYWAAFGAAAYSHYDGTPVSTATPFSLPLSPGWNLIGDPFPAAVPLSSVTVSGTPLALSPAVSPTLYTYNTASGQYVTLSAASDSLQPYAGYWIYVAQNSAVTVLTVPAP